MKKAKLFLIPMIAVSLLAGCGERENGGGSESSLFTYKDGLIDFGSSFDSTYLPDLTKIDQSLSGEITVALVFEGKQSGWEEVANEYMRLHGDSIKVKINGNYSAETYTDAVTNVLGDDKPAWNIVQGNYIGGQINKDSKLSTISSGEKNPYAGNKRWSQVLTTDAFDPNIGTVVNTESLQTAWFVNQVALNAAADHGYTYKNSDNTPANPKTWDELLELCVAMKSAGYSYPLGLSLSADSVNSTQFSWLLRVYGDYYYRDEYKRIVDGDPSTVDLTDPDIELNGFIEKPARLFSTILDIESTIGYVGPTSDKFKEFLGQFKKVAPYINPQAINKSHKAVRDEFIYQTGSKDSPQIMMDYLGEGLGSENVVNDSFKVDYFDNPKMVSTRFINDDRVLRDVGGNGGYLSVVQNTTGDVEKISQDFIKFFLSPYGQSIYYTKLASTNLHPQGMTTVKKNLVVMPENWKKFFDKADRTITFTGQSDKNPYISFLVRFMSTSGELTTAHSAVYWEELMCKNRTVNEFATDWNADIKEDWKTYASTQGYKQDCYLRPDADPHQ